MINKIIIYLIIGIILFPKLNVYGEENLISNAKSGILVEVSTGTVIYEKNPYERVSVASMRKMMGMMCEIYLWSEVERE